MVAQARSARGSPENSWLAARRCLAIVRRLQQGPADKKELLQVVQNTIPEAYTQSTEKAQDRSFERDLENLRKRLHAKIEWDHRLRAYYLVDPGPFARFDLPENALTAIAFLLETFGPNSGAHEILQPLLNFLEKTLSSEQLRRLDRQDSPLRLNLSRLDSGTISPLVWEKVRYAVQQRRIIEFEYLSPQHKHPEPRRHRVEPDELQFERGHYYLKGFCLRWQNPQGYKGGGRPFSYRRDHILSKDFELLPDRVKVDQRRQRLMPIRYRVAPRLWRSGLTRHFEEMIASEPDSEGWVEIQAKTDDLFQAHRTLLAYGELCQVLDPPELVEKMVTAVVSMAKLYSLKLD